MKKYLYSLVLAMGLSFVACSEANDVPNNTIETTDSKATTLVLKGYESTASGFTIFQPQGYSSPFYIKDKQFYGSVYNFAEVGTKRLDEVSDDYKSVSSWTETADIKDGCVYWAWCKSADMYRYSKFRVIGIDGNNVTIEYVLVETSTPASGENVNSNPAVGNLAAAALEMPRLNADYQFVNHYVTYNKVSVLNYSLEWCSTMMHSNWVAFYFDATTCQNNEDRGDKWKQDREVDSKLQPEEANHKSDGYDKGHLVASEDRVYSKEANDQTFYYTNISPQIGEFNQNYWAQLEKQVQDWGRSCTAGTYDKVYVTKGGTLNNLKKNFTGKLKANDGVYPKTDENGKTIKGLACPSYYFMAILSQKGDTYHAIAFLVPHEEGLPKKPNAADLQKYAVSVNELEQATGIDFFCNLDDAIENQVEAEKNFDDWTWLCNLPKL